MSEPANPTRSEAAAALDRALARARWTILWERLWPPLASIATVLGLFLAASWLGLWLWLPPMGRAIGLFIFAMLAAAATVRLFFIRLPSRHDRLYRLDRISGLAHRPATAIADRMAGSQDDPWSAALWAAHVERALLAVNRLKAGLPKPHLPARDPMALRALVLILVVATFFAASGERGRRVAAAFDWQGVVVPANFRLDAWVSPPTYTAKPPVILPGVRPGEATQTQTAAVSVPVGSVLIIRSSGSKAPFDIVTSGGLQEVVGDQRPQAPAGTDERRYTITDRGTATLRGIANEDVTWAFNAIPDRPPTIALAKDPEPQARGALQLSYKIEDDYGVTEAHATFALKDQASAPRPLFGAPDFQLVLPQARTKSGVGQTTKDLTEHPWAGAELNMTLTALDEAGNEGRSAPFELRLPERVFVKPLARALIEQRRALALDAEARDRVLIALDALAAEPERFTPETGIYLGLRAIFWSLSQAKNDDQLRDVVQRLWAMATQLEDGNVSDAEARLRQAQEALRQALERGASDEEIKKLMEELRAALDKFLQALAEEMRKNMASQPLPEKVREILRKSRELRERTSRADEAQFEELAKEQESLRQELKSFMDERRRR